MTEHIYPKKIKGRIYYYLQRSWREKINPEDSGSIKGSGKSRVKTETTYLGTAASIMQRLRQIRKPLEVRTREFGFVAAAYSTMIEIGLVDLLKQHLGGKRFGIPLWVFFSLAIINRLQRATSKESMGKWASKTILPRLLGFDAKRIHSKSFWYATDEVICEKQLREKRGRHPELKEELFVGVDDGTFRKIEEQLFENLKSKYELSSNVLLYDTTNFFTYFEEPMRAEVARSGHNKSSRHHLKQIGLALCVEKVWGIPLFHRLYRGNSHDSKTFAQIVDEMISQIQGGFNQIEELVLVLDKGNNSKENFASLKGKIKWVGSLVLSHFADLIDLPLSQYAGEWKALRYHRCERKVMGIECVLVMSYNEKLYRKQKLKLESEIEKLKRKVEAKWSEYRHKPKSVPAGIKSLVRESRYGKYIEVRCEEGKPAFDLCSSQIGESTKRFGKNLLFCSELNAESGWIISQYKSKQRIEDDFKLVKDPELIRWQPIRHWTDSKIFAFGFCCVMGLVVMRIMQLKAWRAGIKMSPAVLKEELSDLQEVIMVYDQKHAETKVTSRSSIQQRLWELFELERIEAKLTS